MKIAICTLCINKWYEEIVQYGVKTIELYAKKHGYDFIVTNDIYDGERDYKWYKIKVIQKILHNYDFVFWIDADGFVMKPELTLQHFVDTYLPPNKDLLCTCDNNNPLNTGFMILRNTPFIHALLYEVWNNKEPFDPEFHEQASMGQIYTSNRLNAQNKIMVQPLENKNLFYSYWGEYYPNRQFFMHIARCSHDPCGFVFTMDTYCPIKMNEETDEDFKKRYNWLNNTQQCRKDIENSIIGKFIFEPSKRVILYRKKYEELGIKDDIEKSTAWKNKK